MYQQEIKFFWPLTEQIPLELDYSECEKPKLYVNSVNAVGIAPLNIMSDAVTSVVNTNGLEIRCGTITMSDVEMPWYRKAMFKLLGFKWK